MTEPSTSPDSDTVKFSFNFFALKINLRFELLSEVAFLYFSIISDIFSFNLQEIVVLLPFLLIITDIPGYIKLHSLYFLKD